MNSDKNLRRVGANLRMKNIVSAADHEAMHEHYSFVPPDSSLRGKKNTAHHSSGISSRNKVKAADGSWQERMVAKYHEHLFKEFALADLSVPGRIGLRWRTKEEVLIRSGEKTCGNQRCRNSNVAMDDLVALEVPFSYKERGEHKKELVKLKLCETCRPLLQHSTKNRNSTTGTNFHRNESKQNTDFCGNSSDSDNSKKRKLKKSRRKYKKEKKRRRKSRA